MSPFHIAQRCQRRGKARSASGGCSLPSGNQHFALAAGGKGADQARFLHVFQLPRGAVVADAQLALHVGDAGLAVLEHHLHGLVVHGVFLAALAPTVQGQIALAGDPRSSNQAAQTVYAAAIANGGSLDDIQPGLDYFKQLNEAGNLLPLIANTGTIGKGETPITFQWNYLALANKDSFAGNPPLEIVYPSSVNWGGFYLQAVSAYAPNPAAARLWQEFLYSDEGQLIWMKGYCAPARLADMLERGVVPEDIAAKMPDPAVLASSVVPSGDQLSAARELIKNEWDNVVGLDIK